MTVVGHLIREDPIVTPNTKLNEPDARERERERDRVSRNDPNYFIPSNNKAQKPPPIPQLVYSDTASAEIMIFGVSHVAYHSTNLIVCKS